MSRSSALLLIGLNSVVILSAIVVYLLVHPRDLIVDVQAVEQRVAAKLGSVSSPAEMQRAAADVAKMTAGAMQATQGGVTLINDLVAFAAGIGVFNLLFISVGMWQAAKRAKAPTV